MDLIPLVAEFEKKTARLRFPRGLRVALMGCEVNGPGEARDADVGLAFSRSRAFLFRRGRVVERLAPGEALPRLLAAVAAMAREEVRHE